LQYSYNTIRTSRRWQKGIPTYTYWALVLDPRTKKKGKNIERGRNNRTLE